MPKNERAPYDPGRERESSFSQENRRAARERDDQTLRDLGRTALRPHVRSPREERFERVGRAVGERAVAASREEGRRDDRERPDGERER